MSSNRSATEKDTFFSSDELSWVRQLLELPTVSYHEDAVFHALVQEARQRGLHFAQDRFGNLAVSTQRLFSTASATFPSAAQWTKLIESSALILSAHMDHPGFEVVSTQGNQARVRFLGAVHRGQFNSARVRAWDPIREAWVRGRVETRSDLGSNEESAYRVSLGLPVKEVTVTFDVPVSVKTFGGFDQPGYRQRGKLVSTKAADDLFNCALGMTVLSEWKKKAPQKRLTVLFTRAEEEGFIGLQAFVNQLKKIPRTPWVVLETSKAMGGAVLGGGVVVRVGDRATAFHPEAEAWLHGVAEQLRRKDPTFSYQRALLSGGTCEATLLIYKGFFATGLSLPLKNYHNVGPAGPRPEQIHLHDAWTLKELLLGCAKTSSETVFPQLYRDLKVRTRPRLKRLKSFLLP